MLKNNLPNLTLFFDIEWVPDADGVKRVYGLPAETAEQQAIQHLWEQTTGYSPESPRPFVKYLFSRIVSVSFLSRSIVWRDGVKCIDFKLNTLPRLPLTEKRPNEAHIIERFLFYIGEREPNLVGFNSSESDIQVLIQRALIHEISAEKFCMRPPKPWEGRDYFYRYSEEHLDLLKLFSNGQMKPQLNEIARLCGFPGKLDGNGEQVVDLWLAGEVERIIQYNQIDVLNTYLVWLRVVHFCGKLDDEQYQDEQFQFRDFLEGEAMKESNRHLRYFIERWDAEV